MRILGYLSMLAAIVIIAIAAVYLFRSMTGTGGSVETGEQKAVREMHAPGEEPIDPQSEIRDTVRDAMGR